MDRIGQYTHEFINNPTELSESDMRAVMRRGQLSEIEQRIVLREVQAARDSDATSDTATYSFNGDAA